MKKPICLALTAMLTFSGSALHTTSSFADDFSKHWSADAIQVLSNNHFIHGDGNGNFRPNAPITRAEFVTTVNNVFGFTHSPQTEEGITTVPFSDIKGNEWFADAVTIAVANGYVSGYADGTFKPNAPISRAEMSVMIAKVLKLQQSEQQSGFTDSKDIPTWAKGYIDVLATSGYVTGFADGSFKPNQTVTRAESFVVFSKAIEKNPTFLENGKMMEEDSKKTEQKAEMKPEQKKVETKEEEDELQHSRSYTAAEKAVAAKKAEEAFKKIHEAKNGKKIELDDLKKLIKEIDSQKRILSGKPWQELEQKLESEMGKITDLLAEAKKDAKACEELKKLEKAFTGDGVFEATSDTALTLDASLMKKTDNPEKITTVQIKNEKKIKRSFLAEMRNKGVGEYYVNITATPVYSTPIDLNTESIEIKALDNTQWLVDFKEKDDDFETEKSDEKIRVDWQNKTISWDSVENASSYDIKAEFTYLSQETAVGDQYLLDEPNGLQNQFTSETLGKVSGVNLIDRKGKDSERVFVATGLKETQISFDKFILANGNGMAPDTFDNLTEEEKKQLSIFVKIWIIPRNEGLYITEDYSSDNPDSVKKDAKKLISIQCSIPTWFKYFPKIKP